MNRRDVDTYLSEVRVELENKLSKATEILNSIENKLTETENNRQQSAATLTTLNENYNSAITLINQTRDDLAKVTELRAVALDPENGLESLLSKITSTHKLADELKQEISTINLESKSQGEKIKKDAGDSSRHLSQMEKSNVQAQKLLKDLDKTYQLAINTGLAGSFDERKKKIQEEFVNRWAKNFNISMSLLSVLAIFVLLSSLFINGFTLEWLTIFRLALLSPLIFYTGYVAIQYGKERRLLEKYAFKAAVAASIESYTTILTTNFGSKVNEKEILRFVLNSMNLVYSEPHEEIKKRSFAFSLGNKLGSMKSEIVEEVAQKVAQKVENLINQKE